MPPGRDQNCSTMLSAGGTLVAAQLSFAFFFSVLSGSMLRLFTVMAGYGSLLCAWLASLSIGVFLHSHLIGREVDTSMTRYLPFLAASPSSAARLT